MSTSPFAIINPRTGHALGNAVRLADSFWSRFRGLMWTKSLPAGEGLLIVPCNSVHCMGMRYAIDVAFLSRDGQILKVIPDMRPGSLGPPVKGARAVLELPCGTLAATESQVGDWLEASPPGSISGFAFRVPG